MAKDGILARRGFLAAIAIFTACCRSCCDPREIYKRTSATATPPSEIWCGHDWKGIGLPSRPQTLNSIWTRSDSNRPQAFEEGICKSNGWDAEHRVRSAATEKVEVRGTLANFFQLTRGGDEEITFDVLPDWDWTPEAPLVPLNTPEAINRAWTPFFDNPLRIHVEIDGWGPCRPCNVGEVYSNDVFHNHVGWYSACNEYTDAPGHFTPLSPAYCSYYSDHKPSDWTFQIPQWPPADVGGLSPIPNCFKEGTLPNAVDYRHQTYWPFDPFHPDGTTCENGLHSGDYVRIVGTLWEDHGGDHGDCWQTGSGTPRPARSRSCPPPRDRVTERRRDGAEVSASL